MARIVDTWNAATGEYAAETDLFGIRIVYNALFMDGHTEEVSVIVNATGDWQIQDLEGIVRGLVAANEFQGRWGPRYQIASADVLGFAGVARGGYDNAAITL